MADTPTTITCPAGTFTITVRADGSPVHLDKLPCPASPYSLRHEVGVMTGFIALFIIASVVYGIASRIATKRSDRRELDRKTELTRKGFGTAEFKSAERSG